MSLNLLVLVLRVNEGFRLELRGVYVEVHLRLAELLVFWLDLLNLVLRVLHLGIIILCGPLEVGVEGYLSRRSGEGSLLVPSKEIVVQGS